MVAVWAPVCAGSLSLWSSSTVSGANLAGLLDGPARWAPGAAGDPASATGPSAPGRSWPRRSRGAAAACASATAIAPGDTVALFASNHPDYLEILFSIWHAGGVAVPISQPPAPARGGRRCVDRATREGLLRDRRRRATDMTRARLRPVPVVVFGEERGRGAGERRAAARRWRGWPTDDAWIFFTSGTTGQAKGARLTHHNLCAMSAAYSPTSRRGLAARLDDPHRRASATPRA